MLVSIDAVKHSAGYSSEQTSGVAIPLIHISVLALACGTLKATTRFSYPMTF